MRRCGVGVLDIVGCVGWCNVSRVLGQELSVDCMAMILSVPWEGIALGSG